MKKEEFFNNLLATIHKKKIQMKRLTLGEMIDLADRLDVRTSDIVIAGAMEAHGISYEKVI